MSRAPSDRPIWEPAPERRARAALTAFREAVRGEFGVSGEPYDALHRWSIEAPDEFWSALWRFAGVVGEGPGTPVVTGLERMPGARWFPKARLSFAENLLRRRDGATAIVARDEAGRRRELSFAELARETGALAAAWRSLGVRPGERVAAYLPNVPETVIAALAASSLGAVFSSCSPDFGAAGALDRFGAVAPRILVAADGSRYAGREHDLAPRVAEIARGLSSLERLVLVPVLRDGSGPPPVAGAVWLEEHLAPHREEELQLPRFPFDHPLYVLFSSGTTGPPKGIVHGAGGTLLQHLKEHRLHCDIRAGDRVLYYTSSGWMMWNWLVSALACEAAVVLYDGAPLHPRPSALFDVADDEGVSFLGVSARYLDAVRKEGLQPRRTHRLRALRTIASTGSPLAPEAFDYVYRQVAEDVHLASISGGTDIVSCFVLGDPTAPVFRGEIQVAGLGMAVEVYDERGRALEHGRGELVCTRPFPSLPLGFWEDPGGCRFQASYFDRFPGVWCHGDYVERTANGGYVIHGRSDAVLNPGGVRIGTAEIYREVEALDEVEESVAVGQELAGDVRVVLFVKLRPGLALDEELAGRIRRRLRERASPRHVPAVILQVADVPRTRSGKKSELAVREALHGRPVRNVDALANPESLAHFGELPDLRN